MRAFRIPILVYFLVPAFLLVGMVAGLVFVTSNEMDRVAREVVLDHEKIDLDEETRAIAWRLYHQLETIRSDALALAARIDANPGLVPENGKLDAGIISDSVGNRHILISIVERDGKSLEGGRVKKPNDLHAPKQGFLKRVGELQPGRVTFDKEVVPLEEAIELRPIDSRSSREWKVAIHLLWVGTAVDLPATMPDAEPRRIEIVLATDLDRALESINGDSRHIGVLSDERHAQVGPQLPGISVPFWSAKTLEGEFESAGIEVRLFGDRAAAPLGSTLFLAETDDLVLDKEKEKDAQKWKELGDWVRDKNREFLVEEWVGEAAVPRRRLSRASAGTQRIRIQAASREVLEELKNAVAAETKRVSEGSEEVDWKVSERPCENVFCSFIRVSVPRADQPGEGGRGVEPSPLESLSIVRMVFEEEMQADLDNELHDEQRRAMRFFLFALGGIVAFAVGLSYFVTRPLTNMTESANAFRESLRSGEPDVEVEDVLDRLPVKRPDEVGDLARAYSALVRRVQRDTGQLRGILANAFDGIVITNFEGKILEINKTAERIFGQTSEEVRGHDFWWDYFTEESRAKIELSLESLRDNEARSRLRHRRELEGKRANGATFPVEVGVSEVTLGDGESVVTVLVQDITERREAEELLRESEAELRRSNERLEAMADELRATNENLEGRVRERTLNLKLKNEQLERANEDKADSIFKIGHEIIGSLTGVAGGVDQLRRRCGDDLPEKGHEILGRIERAATSIQEVAEQLREVARVRRGRVSLNYRDVSFERLVRNAVELVQPRFDERRHEVVVDLEGAEGTVECDKGRVNQVLVNLLTNAARYTPPDGHVRVVGRVLDDIVRVEVADDGIGIPPDERDSLFKDFHRGSNAGSVAPNGLGVGLSICREFVELHGGEIGVESRLNKGSTFHFEIPRERRDDSDVVVLDPDASGVLPQVLPLRVLVAARVDGRRDKLVETLAAEGHDVECVESGEALVETALGGVPDVVLTVQRLDGLGGRQAAARLRERGCTIPVVLMAINQVVNAEEMGFRASLEFPPSAQRLSELLAELASSAKAANPREEAEHDHA